VRYHQIRNATCVLEFADARVLVDPMLGLPRTLPPYAVVRSKARRNPLTPLPEDWEGLVEGVDACLISHTHFGADCDHLDGAGTEWLKAGGVPVYCRAGDEPGLRKRGLDAHPVTGDGVSFLGGTLRAVGASHGRGLVGKLMGPGAGYVLEIPGEPVLYLTGDTVLTDAVRDTLRSHAPGVCIVPGGGARLDLGGPILMSLDELEAFVRLAPAQVVINHIGALNHCPTTFEDIRNRFGDGLLERVRLPRDGETIELNEHAGGPRRRADP